ncbi:MAG: glycine cleavage system protein GcvH [Aeromonadaceae bacterium]|nr:glycine cleavage system protein GcvH [Aeromonadaceae bacterium]MBP9568734.1 glycine cleavage system protein GcvH [Aeromonadaceae bacterium]
MNHIPSELHYTSTHEWVRLEQNNEAVVGITHHAQMMLGDMVFAELPELGLVLLEGDDVAVVESVKAASDVFTPVSGTLIAVNDELEGAPELINQDPYGAGWLFRVQLDDPEELDGLMDAESYAQLLESEREL